MVKAVKGICVIKRLSRILPRFLCSRYKSFVRLHLDYGDVLLYTLSNNERCSQKIESI